MINLLFCVLLVGPLLLVILVLILHFVMHYQIKLNRCFCCIKCRDNDSQLQYKDEWTLFYDKLFKYFCIIGKKGPRFYPALFLIHLIILVILYSLIMVKFINIDNISYKYCSIDYVLNQRFIFEAKYLNDFKMIDYIIGYLFIYVLLSDLYFNFLRYYSTMKTLNKLVPPSQWHAFKRFSIFAIFFGQILVFEMYYYVGFFAIPIMMYIFNLYCSHNFAKVLLKHYEAAGLDGMCLYINIIY